MSRSFIFKLESILRFRIQEEEQSQMAFAAARQEYERQGELVEDLAQKSRECDERFVEQKHMTEADLWLWGNYRQGVKADHKKATFMLAKTAKNVEKKRSELLICAQKRKLLEKLKSNQATEYAHTERELEQKEFDETATLRYKQAYS